MTDMAKSETDPFSDEEMFAGNGNTNAGLEEVRDTPCIFVPKEYDEKGIPINGNDVPFVEVDVISFGDPNQPEKVEGVYIFGRALVGSFKRSAKKNSAGELNRNGFPFMHLGVPFENKAKKQSGRNAPWDLKPVEDEKVRKAMAAYARVNLKPSSPFDEE